MERTGFYNLKSNELELMRVPLGTYSFDFSLPSFAAVVQGYIPIQVLGVQLFCISESVPKVCFNNQLSWGDHQHLL